MEYSVINRIDAKQPCDYHILGIFNDKKTNIIKSSVDKDIGENIIDSISSSFLNPFFLYGVLIIILSIAGLSYIIINRH